MATRLDHSREAKIDKRKQLEELGAETVEITLPHTEYAVATYYILMASEVSSNLARYDGVHYGHRTKNANDYVEVYSKSRDEAFGAEVKRRIMLGTYALSSGYYDAYYLKALKVRTLIKQDFDRAFMKYDVLLSPTAPSIAFKFGEKTADPLAMYISDIATIPINLAGLPAISLPCGFSKKAPIGLQIIGRAFDEETVLRAAFTYEQNTDWHKQIPEL